MVRLAVLPRDQPRLPVPVPACSRRPRARRWNARWASICSSWRRPGRCRCSWTTCGAGTGTGLAPRSFGRVVLGGPRARQFQPRAAASRRGRSACVTLILVLEQPRLPRLHLLPVLGTNGQMSETQDCRLHRFRQRRDRRQDHARPAVRYRRRARSHQGTRRDHHQGRLRRLEARRRLRPGDGQPRRAPRAARDDARRRQERRRHQPGARRARDGVHPRPHQRLRHRRRRQRLHHPGREAEAVRPARCSWSAAGRSPAR